MRYFTKSFLVGSVETLTLTLPQDTASIKFLAVYVFFSELFFAGFITSGMRDLFCLRRFRSLAFRSLFITTVKKQPCGNYEHHCCCKSDEQVDTTTHL